MIYYIGVVLMREERRIKMIPRVTGVMGELIKVRTCEEKTEE